MYKNVYNFVKIAKFATQKILSSYIQFDNDRKILRPVCRVIKNNYTFAAFNF